MSAKPALLQERDLIEASKDKVHLVQRGTHKENYLRWYTFREGHKTGPNYHLGGNMTTPMKRCHQSMVNLMRNLATTVNVTTMIDEHTLLAESQTNNTQTTRLSIHIGEFLNIFEKTKQLRLAKHLQETSLPTAIQGNFTVMSAKQ